MDIKDPIVANVVDKIIKRHKAGIEKYGTTLAENNSDCFLTHAQEEAMDFVNYLEKAIHDRKMDKLTIKMLNLAIENQNNTIKKYEKLLKINNK